MSWEVAIPSYGRPLGLRKFTLQTLLDGGVPPERIRIFVASDAERDDYLSALDFGTYREILVAAKGMNHVRNLITGFYEHGSKLVEVDDDVRGVFRAKDEKTLERVTDLSALFDDAFDVCEGGAAKLWGLYPVCNALWMKGGLSLSLKPIIGTLWGRIVDRNMAPLACEVKSDIERTLLYWERDGAVARFNNLAPKQNARGGTGGLQTPDGRTLEKSERAAAHLLERWPTLVKRGRPFKDGHAEVKLVPPKR